MRMGASLALIGIGAILAFAVTANTSVFNLHTAGYVCIAIGIIGLYLRSRGWVGKQILVRRTRSLRGGVVEEERDVPRYVRINPGTAPVEAGLPVVPSIDDTVEDRETVPTFRPGTEIVEEQEYRPD
jgi:hypothetical protein